MGLGVGPWKDATVDISADDDLSDAVDLGGEFQDLLVVWDAITSSTVTVHMAKELAGTYYPLHILDDDATGSFASATTAATTAQAILFHIGCIRFIKIACGSGQAADREFHVRGINPV
jgi:hypothetical protein